MTAESDRRMVDVLSGIVQRSRAMQEQGRLQDRQSRVEVDLLEHLLKMAEARVRMSELPVGTALQERARDVATLAAELREESQDLGERSLATRQKSRRARKKLYVARLISGPG